MAKYYTLIGLEHGATSFCVVFGDYDRETVVDELRDTCADDDAEYKCTKIICTNEDQKSIDHKIKQINIRYGLA